MQECHNWYYFVECVYMDQWQAEKDPKLSNINQLFVLLDEVEDWVFI